MLFPPLIFDYLVSVGAGAVIFLLTFYTLYCQCALVALVQQSYLRFKFRYSLAVYIGRVSSSKSFLLLEMIADILFFCAIV